MKELIYLIVLILGVPVGWILENRFRGEIKNWRKRIRWMALTCWIFSLAILFFDYEYKIPVSYTLVVMTITMITLLWRSMRN